MTFPYVRLSGDRGKAARYMREAKQLLARVHGFRAASGVPVFAMRRALLLAGVFLQAQSFGMVDVITIHALPEDAAGRVPPPAAGFSPGVVIWHHALRPMGSPTTQHFQGIVLPVYLGDDGPPLAAGTYFDGPWRGPGATNGGKYGAPPPGLIDERDMYPMHSCAYHAGFDVHAVVQTQDSYIAGANGEWGRVFVGGVPVLNQGYEADNNVPIGARLYEDVLAVAYLHNYTKLVLRYIPLFTLSHEQEIVHDPENDEVPSYPRLDLGFEAVPANSIFDFNPINRYEGTFIVSRSQRVVTGSVADTTCRYIVGKYVLDPEASDPADHFLIEEDTEQIHEKTLTVYSGEFATLTATVSDPVYDHVVNDPGSGIYANYGALLTDVMVIDATSSITHGLSTNYLDVQYSDPYLRHYERKEEQAGGGSRSHSQMVPVGPGAGPPALPPQGEMESKDASCTIATDLIIDNQYSLSVSVSNLPIWTGYDAAGQRFIRRLSGSAGASKTGTLEYHSTFVGSETGSISRTITATYSHTTPEPPDDPQYDWYNVSASFTGEYSRSEEWKSTYKLPSLSRSASSTCTLSRDEGSGQDVSWVAVSSYQSQNEAHSMTGVKVSANVSSSQLLVAPYGDKAVIFSAGRNTDLFSWPHVHAATGVAKGSNTSGPFEVSGGAFPLNQAGFGPRLVVTPFQYINDLLDLALESPPPRVIVPDVGMEGQFLGSNTVPTGVHEQIYSSRGATVHQSAAYNPGETVRAGRLRFWMNMYPGPEHPNRRFENVYVGTVDPGDLVFPKEEFRLNYLASLNDPASGVVRELTLEFPKQTTATVSLSDAFVGNRLFSACIYVERIDRHVLSPYAMGNDASPLRHVAGNPNREVFVVGADAVSVSESINNSKRAEDTPSAVQPVAAPGFFADESDFFAPCALI